MKHKESKEECMIYFVKLVKILLVRYEINQNKLSKKLCIHIMQQNYVAYRTQYSTLIWFLHSKSVRGYKVQCERRSQNLLLVNTNSEREETNGKDGDA